MPNTTPDNIFYPNNTSPKKTIEGHLLDTATSVQAAFNTRPISQNYIINSEFDIWQRGTTFSVASNVYTADRWVTTVSSQTVSRTTDVPTSFTFSLRMQNSGATSTGVATRIESFDSTNLVGKAVTVSFWARTPQTGQTIRAVLSHPTTTADVFSALTTFQTLTATPTSTWARYSFTFNALNSNFARGLQLTIGSNASGDATHDLYIAGIQLEEGTVSTPFRRNQTNIQAELAACQRYYEKSFPINFAPQNGPNTTSFATTQGLFGYVSGNSMQNGFLTFSVPKRIPNPLMTVFGNSSGQTRYRDSITSSTDLWSTAAFQITSTSERGCLLQQNVVNNVVIPVQGHWTADAEL